MAWPEEMEPIGRFDTMELIQHGWIGNVTGMKNTTKYGVLVKLAWYARFAELKKRFESLFSIMQNQTYLCIFQVLPA